MASSIKRKECILQERLQSEDSGTNKIVRDLHLLKFRCIASFEIVHSAGQDLTIVIRILNTFYSLFFKITQSKPAIGLDI